MKKTFLIILILCIGWATIALADLNLKLNLRLYGSDTPNGVGNDITWNDTNTITWNDTNNITWN